MRFKVLPGQTPNEAMAARFDERAATVSFGRVVRTGNYCGSKVATRVACQCGREWTATPESLFRTKFSCKACTHTSSFPAKHEWYRQALREKHGSNYIVLEPYAGSYISIKHRCKKHGVFTASPQATLYSGIGCPGCGKDNIARRSNGNRRTEVQIVGWIQAKHGDRIKLVSPYTGIQHKHSFECSEGHAWQANIDNVTRGTGCPHCNSPRLASRSSLDWIAAVSRRLRLRFEHANLHNRNSTGERYLRGASGRGYYVDGYNHAKRLILEYHGDIWHGNPAVCRPDSRPHPFSTKTARELFVDTIARMNDLRAAGYTVVYVWEREIGMRVHWQAIARQPNYSTDW